MKPVVLSTINARYFHTSLGLRCLRANLGPWRERCEIVEFVLQQRPVDMAEEILARDPWVVGLGVYIWNVELMRELIRILKAVQPDLPLILGGPEMIYPPEWPDIASLADVIVMGEGERALPKLLRLIESGSSEVPSALQIQPILERLEPPDGEYTDEDLAHRLVYVEASRGCSFHCDFCLSAREHTVRRFEPDAVLASIQRLWDRGARQFKFVDRALHLGGVSPRILQFFVDHLDEKTFLHFEVVPEAIPQWAWPLLAAFPAGQLQLEAGVQSLHPETCQRIGRPQSPDRVLAALRRLHGDTHAYLHTDLVLGLPGDTMASIETTFNALLTVHPHEIQVGILKRLRGAPIARHDAPFDMRYNASSPYEILQTSTLDFGTLQRLKRFSRYFDLVFNSGNFPGTAGVLLQGDSAFASFLRFTDWLYADVGQTAGIAQDRLCELLFRYLVQSQGMAPADAQGILALDYGRQGKTLPMSILRRTEVHAGEGVAVQLALPRRQRKHR